ncbi:schlafen family member 2-like, partial [Ylistrum balloti]|uniref:schlafen family member 2-like n=1 Tax=Ylistrum balloti TaxID=509963 RepID=UPI002905CAC9
MERQLSDASEQQGDSRPFDPTDDMFGGKNVLRMEIPIQNIEIDQEKGKPRLNKKDFKSEIFEKVMALRNSGGGVLIIRNQNYDGVDKTNDPLYKDQFTTMVSDGMQQMATYRGEVGEFQSWYRSVWKGDGKWLLYYIKEGRQFTFPLESKVYTVNENNHRKVGIEEIQRRLLQSTKTPPNYHPSVTHVHCDEKHGKLRLGKKCSYLHESTNIQLKSFNDINSMCKNIREYTTAFCQNKNGGSMCFGIEEKQNSETKKGSTCSKTPVVCGVQFNKDDDAIRQEIKKTMSEKMLWIRHNGENADPDEICQYYDVRFHNVDPENRSKKVIEVSVAKFYGCVFSDEPKPCYLDGGEIKYYTVKEWVQILMKDHLKDYKTTEIHADLRPLI